MLAHARECGIAALHNISALEDAQEACLVLSVVSESSYGSRARAKLACIDEADLCLALLCEYCCVILDSQVQLYFDALWHDGELLSLAGDTLSSLQHFQPSCKRRIPGGWRITWQLHELPSRAPPFTWPTLLVVLGKFCLLSPIAALGVRLAFRALLRTGEILSLTRSDIVISPNQASAVLTGNRNPCAGTVNITDLELVTRLAKWQKPFSFPQKIIPWPAAQFRKIFQNILEETAPGAPEAGLVRK